VLASCPAHKVNQITAEPRKNESASRHPALGGNTGTHPRVSPLQLADGILSLAQAADRAGHPAAAQQLLDVMNAVLDQ